MDTTRVIEMTDDIVKIAEQLKSGVVRETVQVETYREIYALRRTVETLEREVRGGRSTALGDAC
jgi:HAMP domain-containing protein